MAELRKDPINQRWVIVNGLDGEGIAHLNSEAQVKKGGDCPFCRGQEDKTPPAIFQWPEGEVDWQTRVIPNKFPALQIEGDLDKSGCGIYDRMHGVGAHEVIVESPDHFADFTSYTAEQAQGVIRTFQSRYLDLLKDRRFKYILIFKNFGRPAGASLEHCHSQLIATPVIPKRVMEEMETSLEYYNYRERCVFCDIIAEERSLGTRLIHENERFVVIAPFAARFACESWILPREHSSDFEHLDPDGVTWFAEALQTLLRKQARALKQPPFNFILHTAPAQVKGLPFYHWHVEVMPRLTRISGVEWGTGFYINPVSPETTARVFRNTVID